MNKQLLSLALLTSIACTAVANDRCKRKDQCDNGKEVSFQRKFNINLSFDQELLSDESDENGGFIPASEVKPAPQNVCGRLELCFAKDLSSLTYRLFVFGANGKENPNEKITMAHLHAGQAFENGQVFLFLFNAGVGFGCGEAVDGLLAEGTRTNSDIIPQTSPDGTQSFNSIASILAGILNGQVYCNVHGAAKNSNNPAGNFCDPDKTAYNDGIVRGQVVDNCAC